MDLAAGGALQQDKAVAWRIRIIFDPMLHVLMNDRTAKHDVGRCSSICRTPALLVTQINVEQLIFGWLQRAFDPAAHNRRFQRIDPVAAVAVILNFLRRGGSSLHRLSAAAVFIAMMVMYGFAQMGSGSLSYRGRDVDELLGLARYYYGNGNRALALEYYYKALDRESRSPYSELKPGRRHSRQKSSNCSRLLMVTKAPVPKIAPRPV